MLRCRLSRRIAVAHGEGTALGNGLGSALNAPNTDTPGSRPSVQKRCGPRHLPQVPAGLVAFARPGPEQARKTSLDFVLPIP